MDISTVAAPELILDVLKAGLVPMLHGSPGLGKSDICKAIAKANKLKVIDLRLSQSDPNDLNGFPAIDMDRKKAGYVPMSTFPVKGDPIPEGYEGWLILLDEINSAPLSIQAAAYKLILDRYVGDHPLHEKVAMIAAGNKATDKAIVNRLSTAMQSRLIHLNIESDTKAWLDWAAVAEIDYRIRAFIGFRPDLLFVFDPNHNDNTFACGRTWEFTSRLIKPWAEITYQKLPLLAGTIGEGVAREFFGYCEIFGKLPTIEQIKKSPDTLAIPHEPSVKYATSGLLSHHITPTNIVSIMPYLERLPVEFQIITLQSAFKKKDAAKLMAADCVKQWVKRNAQELL